MSTSNRGDGKDRSESDGRRETRRVETGAEATSASDQPHGRLPLATNRERFLATLFDRLWDQYRSRVSYVQTYEQVVAAEGATFFNDHIAFRTIAWQQPMAGIASIARLFEALGYRAAGSYYFADKHLAATHFAHPHPQFPKLFVSEFCSWMLPAALQHVASRVLQTHRPTVSLELLSQLAQLDKQSTIGAATGDSQSQLLDDVLAHFTQLPWDVPERADVMAINQASQYAAWVLVHGYAVNHFTSLVNSHGCESLDSLEKTIAALAAAGVPMKAEIEGAVGSKLRQSATEAVSVEVAISDAGRLSTMPWTYAYFELAERNEQYDPQTGKHVRFEGFLGPQATNLFEMTRVK